MLVPADDEHELRVLRAKCGYLDVRPQMQVCQADDEIDPCRIQRFEGPLGMFEIARLGRHVTALVTTVFRVQKQTE